jgi:hypothetical protein
VIKIVYILNTVGFLSVREELRKNGWVSLPELTNAHGGFCYGSSSAQAWSVSCMIDALYELGAKLRAINA